MLTILFCKQMGAAHAIGVDIDLAAISSAEYNASLNNLEPDTLQVYVASANGEDPVPKDSTGFDVVAANILLNPLLELVGRITGYCKPGGLVGVSGILVEQVNFNVLYHLLLNVNIDVFRWYLCDELLIKLNLLH